MTVTGDVEVGSVNQVYHARWIAVVTPTKRTTFVRNRCVIEIFGGVSMFLCYFMNFLLMWDFMTWDWIISVFVSV